METESCREKPTKDPEELFSEILDKCRRLGIGGREFRELPAVRRLRRPGKGPRGGPSGDRVWFRALACSIAACALVIAVGAQPLALFLARMWFQVRGRDLEAEMCVLDMPPEVQHLFMPPFDCSVCRNLTSVERVTGISPEEFENRFAYSLVPVIVSDGTANWTALDSFSFEFFRQLYLGDDDDMEGEWECQFFPYQTEFMSLAEALAMTPERAEQPWYIGWSNCDTVAGSILRKHYHRPYFLPLQSESTNIDWIFMGTPGYGAHMHIDHVTNPSWQAQIKGSKLWTLEPVPECYNECRSIEAIVYPGEVIVLDTNRWYHKTLIIGNDLSITIGSEFD